MEDKGCILFSSCYTSLDAIHEIIKDVLRVSTFPVGNLLIDDVTAYNWTIDNKYYIADVNVCVCLSRTIGNEKFADSVHAIVLHFDSNNRESFDIVQAWNPFINLIDPSVRLLVCDTCTDETEVTLSTVQLWCIENAFELVTLIQDDDDEDEFDVVGIDRIRSALEAYSWPNLTLKNTSAHSNYIESLMASVADVSISNSNHDTEIPSEIDCEANLAHGEDNSTTEYEDKHSTLPNNVATSPLDANGDEAELLAALGNDDPGPESFEIMFTRLKNMKDKAASLTDEERKIYAEKVALTFWRSVGGDDSEIDDLSD